MDPHPWDPLPTETDRAYRAFLVYRDLGPGRSAPAVGEKCGIGRSQPERWCARFDWPARALAWDAHQRRILDDALAERTRAEQATLAGKRAALLDQHLDAASTLLRLALRGMQPRPLVGEHGYAILGKDGQPIYAPPTQRDLAASAQALDKAIHHQRLAVGLPTDITRQDVVWEQKIKEASDVNAALIRVLQEHLCTDCRGVALTELERLAQRHAAQVGVHSVLTS